MNDDIKVWIQLFFDDGTVSQGKRIPAYWLDLDYEKILAKTSGEMMKDLNRTAGYRIIWGAGNFKVDAISYVEESETLALES